jgi:hypothetical protein
MLIKQKQKALDLLSNTCQLPQTSGPHEEVDLQRIKPNRPRQAIERTHRSQAQIHWSDNERVPHPNKARGGQSYECGTLRVSNTRKIPRVAYRGFATRSASPLAGSNP